jgi:hypothetical protein
MQNLTFYTAAGAPGSARHDVHFQKLKRSGTGIERTPDLQVRHQVQTSATASVIECCGTASVKQMPRGQTRKSGQHPFPHGRGLLKGSSPENAAETDPTPAENKNNRSRRTAAFH